MGRSRAASVPGSQRTQEVLAWLLRNGRREQLCAKVAATSGAPYTLVEDAFQEVCHVAATTEKCRGESEGVFNWLLVATLRKVGKLRGRAYYRHEIPVDWGNSDQPEPTAGRRRG